MPIHPTTFLGRWMKLSSQVSVTYRKPHPLRHTYASLLIQNGESLAYVRDQLGHSSVKITVDTYSHLAPGGNKAAVDRLDELTGRNLYATGMRSDREGCLQKGARRDGEASRCLQQCGLR